MDKLTTDTSKLLDFDIDKKDLLVKLKNIINKEDNDDSEKDNLEEEVLDEKE